jgi:putative oxidoreductase
MNTPLHLARKGLDALDHLGLWIGLLSLRLLLAWEFGEAGFEKLHGSNWFADIQDQFPWPFKLIPADINWALATGFEVVGAIALVVGLGTRFFSASLIVLTVVAMFSVHWPESWTTWAELLKGYALTNDGFGNFKLPVIYIAMLLPLVLMGPGRLSLDDWVRARFTSPHRA